MFDRYAALSCTSDRTGELDLNSCTCLASIYTLRPQNSENRNSSSSSFNLKSTVHILAPVIENPDVTRKRGSLHKSKYPICLAHTYSPAHLIHNFHKHACGICYESAGFLYVTKYIHGTCKYPIICSPEHEQPPERAGATLSIIYH